MRDIRLVRKTWKVNKDLTNVVLEPAKTVFQFWLNVRTAAYFACYNNGLNLSHDEIVPYETMPQCSDKLNRRKGLNLK